MLDNFFRPGSVAVIGASSAPGKVGFEVMRNLVHNEYDGKIYPVNVRGGEVFGHKCYTDVKDIPGKLDLVVIMIPPPGIPEVIRDSGAKGADSAIVISAGFKETGPEGAALERAMIDAAKEAGIRLLGPNCLGLVDTFSSLNTSFTAGMPEKGNIGFMSQSGALLASILDWSFANGIGFSKFISLGNKADIDEVDILIALGDDPNTKVIVGYLESVNRGKEFLKTALEVNKKKPVIIIKSGVSEAGARAATSHTGSLSGSDAGFEAAFAQSGVLRARTIEELFAYAVAFSSQPLPAGDRLAILTNAGGPGIMATDAVATSGIQMARFESETVVKLKEKLPPAAAFYNPVDIIGDGGADRYHDAITAILEDKGVDGVAVLLTPAAMTQIEETAKTIVFSSLVNKKPILTSFMGQEAVASGVYILKKNRIPNYGFPERAVDAFAKMAHYAEWMKKPVPETIVRDYDRNTVKQLIQESLDKGKPNIGGEKALAIIQRTGITIPDYSIAEDVEAAKKIAESFGYPIVMKVSSPDISHKSDVGGVIVGIKDEAELAKAYDKILISCRRALPNCIIYGVEIHKMITGGKELVIGMNRDPQFGPLVMFGLGGIYVEIHKDVVFRIAPLSEDDIESMITGIRSAKLLTGARGEPPKDIDAVREALRRVSALVTDFEVITEMDINPLTVMDRGEGVFSLDARFSFNPDAELPDFNDTTPEEKI